MFGILNQKFEGKIPNFELIEARKMVAKFIGLTFFKLGRECLVKLGPNCAVNGPCCALHRLEGLKEAHEIFPKLFEPFGINLDKITAVTDTFFTSLLAVLIDFKTQIVVSDLALMSAKSTCESLSVHLENLLENYYGNSMDIPYLKGKLQQRAVQIRGLLIQEEGDLAEKLMEKFPKDLFESNLKNVLRNIYSAFPETLLTEMINKNLQGEEKIIKVTSVNTTVKPTVNTSVNTTVHTAVHTTVNTTAGTANINDDDVADEPFKNVIISGKFFRGILEPVDERFAAIIEGRDVNVKQYLSLHRKKAANNEKFAVNQPKKTKISVPVEVDNKINRAASSSLMERHDSAERIAWETQPENAKNAESTGSEVEEEVIRVNRPPSNESPRKFSRKTSLNGRGRRRFSDKEVANLIEGVRRFGNNWRRIQDTYEFDHRSNVDLKDKARNLKVLGLL